jgi:hypothetical protein
MQERSSALLADKPLRDLALFAAIRRGALGLPFFSAVAVFT